MSNQSLAGRIIAYMQAKKYQVSSGPRRYNIVYLEGADASGSCNADLPNCFNDRRLLIQILDGKSAIIGNWEATTEPGTHYTQQPMNPGGAARIAFGQYAAWSVGMHGARDRHQGLIQVAPIRVHRDFNRDFKRTGDQICSGLFGVNQHWGYDLPVNNIAAASAGCLVGRTRVGHQDFMALIKQDERYQANRSYIFPTTIIAADDLAKFPG